MDDLANEATTEGEILLSNNFNEHRLYVESEQLDTLMDEVRVITGSNFDFWQKNSVARQNIMAEMQFHTSSN